MTAAKSGSGASGSKAAKSKQKDAKDEVKVIEETADGVKHIIVDSSIEKECYVEQALADHQVLQTIIDALCGEARRARQFSATIVSAIAKEKPEVLEPSVDNLVDALHRPEAETRWEILDALYYMIPSCLERSDEVEEAAEESLWDENSGPARLAAFRLLCAMGAADPKISEEVWPSIDEAIQCYHGDLEFNDMLGELILFANGNASDEVKGKLADRMAFDAKSGKGVLGNKAKTIVSACRPEGMADGEEEGDAGEADGGDGEDK